MNRALGQRPVFHHREDSIRTQVQLFWLTLLSFRVVENATDDTGRNIRHELDRLHLVTLATGGQVAQWSALAAGPKAILAPLKLPGPPGSSTSPPPATDRAHPARALTVGTQPRTPHARFRRSAAVCGPSYVRDLLKSGQSRPCTAAGDGPDALAPTRLWMPPAGRVRSLRQTRKRRRPHLVRWGLRVRVRTPAGTSYRTALAAAR